MPKTLLEITGLKKYYPIEAGIAKKQVGLVKAVDDVTLSIQKNEVLGVVGESGCGKTTLGRTILRIIEPTEGSIKFNFDDREIDFTSLDKKELRGMRRYIQMIFQNPYTSLNPRMTIFDIVAEPMRLAGGYSEEEISERVRGLIDKVGLEVKHLNRYPHAFSGGQRQRIGIARALALGPKFVVADEAVSALDVSIQAQILNLLLDLKDKNGLTYVFISHNLAVVKFVSDKIGVMYFGKLVEVAGKDELFENCLHPYSCALLSAVPIPDPDVKTKRLILEGDLPNLMNPPKGCIFQDRCPFVKDICRREEPELSEFTPGHQVACHRAGELDLRIVEE